MFLKKLLANFNFFALFLSNRSKKCKIFNFLKIFFQGKWTHIRKSINFTNFKLYTIQLSNPINKLAILVGVLFCDDTQPEIAEKFSQCIKIARTQSSRPKELSNSWSFYNNWYYSQKNTSTWTSKKYKTIKKMIITELFCMLLIFPLEILFFFFFNFHVFI